MSRDPLTNLLGAEEFETLVAGRQRARDASPVALIEIAGLARYNDEAGREAGDSLLLGAARRIERLARDEFGAGAAVGRIGGARFAILAPSGYPVDRLRMEVRGIAGSIGDLTDRGRANAVGTRIAVGALDTAQSPEGALAAVARRLSAPPALVRAIDAEAAAAGEGLSILFQPQFAFAGDRLTGAEALVRWQHPRLGEVGGALLFAAAAAAGQERQLSRAVWSCALDAMACWPSELAHLRVALNITAADVAAPDMADELLLLACRAGVAPARLTVEVTETAIIERIDEAAATLSRLRGAGLCAALDDFGTGYSGLSWLKRLPVDYIKIDSGFARDAGGAARDRAVLRGVIDIAHALGLEVLAEGVESAGQRERLEAMGCRWYQGHLRAPALGNDAFVAFAKSAL